MKRFLLLIAVLGYVCAGYAQKQEIPGWIHNTPKASNGTYQYVVEYALGTSEAEARNRAIAQVFQTIMMRIGMPVSSTEINQALQEGKSYGEISMTYNIPINKVCEYSEKVPDGYKVFVLCQVAKPRISPNFTEFKGCGDAHKYRNWVSGVESALLPGLGQMTKRRGGKGSLFLLSEMMLGGAVIATKVCAKYELAYLKDGVDIGKFNTTTRNYNNLKLANNICFWTLVAVHVGNIVHATLAKPKYKTPKVKKHTAFYPTTIYTPYENNMALGLGCTVNF